MSTIFQHDQVFSWNSFSLSSALIRDFDAEIVNSSGVGRGVTPCFFVSQ